MPYDHKKPFMYNGEQKFHGAPVSSSSVAYLANAGVHKFEAASTYTLAGPGIGNIVTLVSTVDASVVSKTSTGGQVSFNLAGGTQVLNLLYDSTALVHPCVSLLGVAATQWVITSYGAHSAASMATSNAGISVST
jgi:hypothetical protein